LLSSNRTAEVVALLAASYDVILLDCSPVLPVTDAAVIAGLAEATVLVVNIGESTRREIGRMIEILQQVDAPIIGTVLNGVSADGSDGYYRHTRYYRATTTEDTGPRRLVGHAAGH
jgi:Mrp family chromosome partitioning ATPase